MAKGSNTGSIGRDRKKTLLAVLACIFVLSLTYRLLNPYEQKRVKNLTFTGEKAPAAGRKKPSANFDLRSGDLSIRLDLLTDRRIHSGTVQKNLFFEETTVPVKEKPVDIIKAPPKETEKPISHLENKRLQIQQELSDFKTFGFLELNNEKTLFLERGKDIFIIRKGDRVNGKYLVKEISESMLTLRAEEINEDVHIDISKF